MSKKKKISFSTKLLSNRYYLNEVSVEGKTTRKFYFKMGLYDLYAAQIIRAGNCITLLSNPISISEASFWNTVHFETYARYVFWTFSESFLFNLLERMQRSSLPVLNRCKELLGRDFSPYEGEPPADADEELKWCFVKMPV